MTRHRYTADELHARMIVTVGVLLAIVFSTIVLGMTYGLLFVSQPEKQAPNDAAFIDLMSTIDFEIPSFGRALIPTGISFELPEDYEIQVRPKSGLAINHGLTVLNTPGTIDEGYTGEVKVIVFNTNKEPFKITKGMKVAQCVVSRCITGRWVTLNRVEEIKSGERGNNGFGSTGI